jgi:hypothetical protein
VSNFVENPKSFSLAQYDQLKSQQQKSTRALQNMNEYLQLFGERMAVNGSGAVVFQKVGP